MKIMPPKRKGSGKSGLTPEAKVSKSSVYTDSSDNMDKNIAEGTGVEKNSDGEVTLEKVYALVACLPKIQEDIKDIKNEQLEQSKSLQFVHDEVEDLRTRMDLKDEEVLNLQTRLDKMEAEAKEWRQSHDQLERKVMMLESHSRRDNLVFENINEDQNENCKEKILNLINEDMGITENIILSRVHRLNSGKSPRPIIVKFHLYPQRELVWSKRSSLKNSPVVVREDYPAPMAKDRAVLYPFYRAALNRKIKARLVQDRLIINDKPYTAADIANDKLPEALKPRNVFESVSEDGKYHLFASKYSPFSNFHQASFTVQGVQFSCSEQYLVYRKAQCSTDAQAASGILKLHDPAKMKRAGLKLDVDQKLWNQQKVEHMKTALYAKFTQNEQLKAALLETHPTTLVECNKHDKFWSSGVSIFFKNAFDSLSWKGKNVLGELLTDLREDLRNR